MPIGRAHGEHRPEGEHQDHDCREDAEDLALGQLEPGEQLAAVLDLQTGRAHHVVAERLDLVGQLDGRRLAALGDAELGERDRLGLAVEVGAFGAVRADDLDAVERVDLREERLHRRLHRGVVGAVGRGEHDLRGPSRVFLVPTALQCILHDLRVAVRQVEVGVVVAADRPADGADADQQRQPDGEHHDPPFAEAEASETSKHFGSPPMSVDDPRAIGSCVTCDATLSIIDERCDIRLGWNEALEEAWNSLGLTEVPGRVMRLDRGWSTVLRDLDAEPLRIRNIGAEVAVGDWVVPSVELDRVEAVLPRRSAFVRRASFEGSRAESQTIAANIDVVMLVHALTSPPNQRRLERELVLAWDSGARPVVVLTKRDLVDDPAASERSLHAAAPGVAIVTASGISGEGVDELAAFAAGNATIALLGASGVGKSTLINALVGRGAQATAMGS